MSEGRDALSPREVAERLGFSYHAVLRAIRRGDLKVTEPIKGQYRIDMAEYERWRRTPARPAEPRTRPRARRTRAGAQAAGSFDRLTAIEGGG